MTPTFKDYMLLLIDRAEKASQNPAIQKSSREVHRHLLSNFRDILDEYLKHHPEKESV